MENQQLGEDCSALRIPDLDGGEAEQPALRSGPPTLGSMQIAAAIEFRPEQADPWVVVGVQRGGAPGIHSCKGLREAEAHAEAVLCVKATAERLVGS